MGKKKRDGAAGTRGKQPGAPGSNLAWSQAPDQRRDRFPEGWCECGAQLAGAADLGVVDRYQQVEVPLMTATRIQFDQHVVRCGCGKVHTAARPEGARPGPVGYGPNLRAFAVYLLVVQFIPVQRCVRMLESLTGAVASPGFVHAMLSRAAALTDEADKRIRALITLAYAVCCDETPLRVGVNKPKPGRRKAEKYLLVTCTELWTHYQFGDRDLATFTAFVVKDLTASVVVHDRYQNYDSAELGVLVHQLCCAHLLRDLDGAAEVYPDAVWPKQISDALRALIHEANLARQQNQPGIDDEVKAELLYRLHHGVLVGLSDTTTIGARPGERKARLPLEVFRDRRSDVLRFVDDLKVPPTSNQAERDLRPAKIQQNICGHSRSPRSATPAPRCSGNTRSPASGARAPPRGRCCPGCGPARCPPWTPDTRSERPPSRSPRSCHYILVLKGNQPLALASAQALLSSADTGFAARAHTATDRGHGRTESRTGRVAECDDYRGELRIPDRLGGAPGG